MTNMGKPNHSKKQIFECVNKYLVHFYVKIQTLVTIVYPCLCEKWFLQKIAKRHFLSTFPFDFWVNKFVLFLNEFNSLPCESWIHIPWSPVLQLPLTQIFLEISIKVERYKGFYPIIFVMLIQCSTLNH